jgi:hypothetical protein
MVIEEFAKIAIPILVVAFFSSLIPRKLNERQKFIEAAAEFRKIFTPELVDIRDENIPFDIYSIDNDVFKRRKVAYLSFRHYLKGIRRRHYDDAWDQYCNDCESHWDFDYSVREKVAKDIEQLLEFTEHRLLRSMFFVCSEIWWKIRFRLFGPDKETRELIEKISKHDESHKK